MKAETGDPRQLLGQLAWHTRQTSRQKPSQTYQHKTTEQQRKPVSSKVERRDQQSPFIVHFVCSVQVYTHKHK